VCIFEFTNLCSTTNLGKSFNFVSMQHYPTRK
jgi:hypothetical protein